MDPIEFKHALARLAELSQKAYDTRQYSKAFTLLEALEDLCKKINGNLTEYIPADYIEAIIRKPRELMKALIDPRSEVTPELFVEGIKEALISNRDYGDRPSFESIIMQMWGMQRRKGADYGSGEDPLANLKGAESWGIPAWLSTLLRIDDKRMRLISFVKRGDLINEGPKDAFIDYAVYSVHAIRLFMEWLAERRRTMEESKQIVENGVCVTNPADD